MTNTIQRAVQLYKEARYVVEHKNQQELIKFLQDNKGTYEIDTILEHINCNLALAGDTRGGEIKIFGEPVLDNHKYNKDYYKIKNTELYVSNGIGNDTNIRYFNHPSISLYRLVNY